MRHHIKSQAHILNLSTLTKFKVLRESLHVLKFVQTYCWSRFHIHCIYKISAMQSVQKDCTLLNVNWPYNKSKDIPTWVECKKDKLFWYSVCYYIKRTTNVAFSLSSLLSLKWSQKLLSFIRHIWNWFYYLLPGILATTYFCVQRHIFI